MIDSAFTPLLPYLQQPDCPTLWFADENAIALLSNTTLSSQQLHIVTNRYDIYQLALAQHISVEFNDFTLEALPYSPQRIIYRISKEKALTHYLFNQTAKHLVSGGELIISGKKQEGIKTYTRQLHSISSTQQKLVKSGSDYYGCFKGFNPARLVDDQAYATIHTQALSHPRHNIIHTKPGVFGWNKIDAGTELLLQQLTSVLQEYSHQPQKILDLGCGYGWIFLNLPDYLEHPIEGVHIIATDNNAAAITCAQQNAKDLSIPTHIIADDCGASINDKFDLILCNPPFHQGFTHNKSLTKKFLQHTRRLLNKNGIALFVVNEFIGFPQEQLTHFDECKTVIKTQGFRVILLR